MMLVIVQAPTIVVHTVGISARAYLPPCDGGTGGSMESTIGWSAAAEEQGWCT